MFDGNVPGLVVDSGADEIQFVSGDAKDGGNLIFAVNFAVTQADGAYVSVAVAGQVAMALGLE